MKKEYPIIICGFPGIGKSHLAKNSGFHDSDSSNFSWLNYGEEPKVRNPDFPKNYIEHITELDGIVLASSHKAVRDALAEAKIPFYLCYPDPDLLEEYCARYEQRGSPPEFVALVRKFWDEWIADLENQTRCEAVLVLEAGKYLDEQAIEDLLKHKRIMEKSSAAIWRDRQSGLHALKRIRDLSGNDPENPTLCAIHQHAKDSIEIIEFPN